MLCLPAIPRTSLLELDALKGRKKKKTSCKCPFSVPKFRGAAVFDSFHNELVMNAIHFSVLQVIPNAKDDGRKQSCALSNLSVVLATVTQPKVMSTLLAELSKSWALPTEVGQCKALME